MTRFIHGRSRVMKYLTRVKPDVPTDGPCIMKHVLLPLLLQVQALITIQALQTSNRVAILSGHKPHSWSDHSSCKSDGSTLTACNLRIYEQAASIAASSGAELLLLPEAYGLSGKVGGFERYVAHPQAVPCEDGVASVTAPAQHRMSCVAKQHNLTVVVNFFVVLANNTRRIVEVAFEAGTGKSLASYFKHHLFPSERLEGVHPGPFAPTSFTSKSGTRWGLLICYEGMYADLFRDWSQLDALKKEGADGILWSIGGVLPAHTVGRALARHVSLPVLSSEDGASAVALGGDANPLQRNASLPLPPMANYTGHASVDVFVM